METVLILTNSINGLYSFRRELIQKLIDLEYKVIIAAPEDEKTAFFTEIGCENIETSINRRGTNPITDFKLLLNYMKVLKVIKPTVVLTYTIKPNVYGGIACRLLRVPQLANITGLGTALENKGILREITSFLYKIALKRASRVFVQNRENQKFLKDYCIVKDNSRLIPGSGVNPDHFSLIEYPSDEKIRFLFIGRVMKETGIDQYLEAAEYIKRKYPHTEFHILGSCQENYETKLKKMQEERIIIYHGRQNDVREFHRISHCTIHPTFYPEGMSNVLLESAACGRPIITTNRAGCREIVDEGVNGLIVKEKDSKDLIDKIEEFLGIDYEKKRWMGLLGRKKVENEFDRKIVVNAYIEEIQKVI